MPGMSMKLPIKFVDSSVSGLVVSVPETWSAGEPGSSVESNAVFLPSRKSAGSGSSPDQSICECCHPTALFDTSVFRLLASVTCRNRLNPPKPLSFPNRNEPLTSAP